MYMYMYVEGVSPGVLSVCGHGASGTIPLVFTPTSTPLLVLSGVCSALWPLRERERGSE